MGLEQSDRNSHDSVCHDDTRRRNTAIRVGTAGWSIPRASARHFDAGGTHLWRYSRRLSCAEINSSFYRPHASATYAKWRDSTPPAFRFAVKLPRTITHERGLAQVREPLVEFLDQIEGLAEKRGPILIQLPPSLVFDESVVTRFFELIRGLYLGAVVCEPRHATWFTPAADFLLKTFAVARAAADPPPVPSAYDPGAWPGIAYFRLHGSPRKYWSPYSEEFLAALTASIGQVRSADEVWCVFDNTASGAAAANALELSERLGREASSSDPVPTPLENAQNGSTASKDAKPSVLRPTRVKVSEP
jgi:uncharacterized protein YecE (DUF72 family)